MPLDFTPVNYPLIDHWLSRFVLEVRRKDGKPYPPNTLYNIVSGIQRYYKDEKERPDLDFLSSSNHFFISLRKVLDSRMKKLTEEGLNIVQGSDTVTPDDEEKLWATGIFNLETAVGLSYCVFFYNGKIFGLRGGTEHRDLKPQQFQFVTSAEGEYLQFTSRNTKNVSGGLATRKVLPRQIQHYADHDNDRCVVNIFKKYLSLIPKEGAFYKKPLDNQENRIVFSSQNVGENKLRTYMKTIFQGAGINTDGRKITNHSARKCQITTMYHAGLPDFDIRARSGHRSNSLDQYKQPNSARKKSISQHLNPPSTISRADDIQQKQDSNSCRFSPILPKIDTAFHPPLMSSTPLRMRTESDDFLAPPPKLQRMDSLPSTVVHSSAADGNDALKIVVPECINKLIVHKGTRETIIILNWLFRKALLLNWFKDTHLDIDLIFISTLLHIPILDACL